MKYIGKMVETESLLSTCCIWYGNTSWNSDYYFYCKILFSICEKSTYFKI